MNYPDNNYIINPKTAKKGITRNPRIDLIQFPKEEEGKNIVVLCNPSGYGFIKKDEKATFFDGDL